MSRALSYFSRLVPLHWYLRYRMNKAARAYYEARITFPITALNPTPSDRAAAETNLRQCSRLKRASIREYLYNELHRLNIRAPSIDDPKYYEGNDFLTDEGERQFRAWIAEHKKANREALAAITGVIGVSVGLISSTALLISTARQCTPHPGTSPASPTPVVLLSNPTPITTTPTPSPPPFPTLTQIHLTIPPTTP